MYTSYAVTFGLVGMATLWIWLDGRARQKELKALEASGIRRRSAVSAGEGGQA
ncbi:heme exporter protein CcmD [Rhizobium sp. RU36D]|uniref:heme exporter protein CcmD n=1 Tax=Rhizobium sp. RU36D TaxID=1907415 RepID=UPI001FCE2AE1|nr:heme exporter protein CcmD [Rhizobium sp. RU36D]